MFVHAFIVIILYCAVFSEEFMTLWTLQRSRMTEIFSPVGWIYHHHAETVSCTYIGHYVSSRYFEDSRKRLKYAVSRDHSKFSTK